MLTTPLLSLLLLLLSAPSSPKPSRKDDKAYRQQVLVMQRGVAKALEHLKVKLKKEEAGDKVLAKIEELDQQNKAEMKEVEAGGKLAHIPAAMPPKVLKEVRKVAEVLVFKGPVATHEIEKGLVNSLVEMEGKDGDYQINLSISSTGESKLDIDFWTIGVALGWIPVAMMMAMPMLGMMMMG